MKGFFRGFYHSFPIQLLLFHLRNNQVLLAFWAVLFMISEGGFAKSLGIPYLFLDPEYIDKVDFWSFFIMGVSVCAFTIAYHITCYILDGYRFSFLAGLRSPFVKFSLNNSLIPMVFALYYIYCFVDFQMTFENNDLREAATKVIGFVMGGILMLVITVLYFKTTSKRLFVNLAENVDKRLKKNKMNRGNILNKLSKAQKSKILVLSYFQLPFQLKKVEHDNYIDKESILHIFDQNQLNAIILQFVSLMLVFFLGLFREIPAMQIPAAASVLFLFAITLMFAGSIAYWIRGWAITFVIMGLLLFGILYEQGTEDPYHKAFGLNYDTRAEHTLKRIRSLSSGPFFAEDKENTLIALENCKKKHDSTSKPYMFFICSSGGGQRAAVWTMRMLQQLDSALLKGTLLDRTMLMTGASGGLIGAGYYREVFYRRKRGEIPNLYDGAYVDNLAKDKLNPMILSLVVGDLTFRFQTIRLGENKYYRDRGYALEQKILKDTDYFLDKNIAAYRQAEQKAEIPMMLLAPTIVNGGRKLYISSLGVSYLSRALPTEQENMNLRVKGIDFRSFFKEQDADSLRFVTALRMSATFPYITPSVLLPSEPAMEIMDAGLTDNFGVSDAVRFLYVFREWIAENTRGVIFINIRDDIKIKEIEPYKDQHYLQKAFTPIQKILGNMNDLQDINNDNNIEYAHAWFDGEIHTFEFEYDDTEKSKKASLSWRLTTKEKESIQRAVYNEKNRLTLERLGRLLNDTTLSQKQ